MSDIEANPKMTTTYRMLRAVVIVLGVLIVIALVALVAGLSLKFGATGPTGAAQNRLTLLPKGAKIVDMQSQPNRLILRLNGPAGEEVDIIDTGDGHVISRIKIQDVR
jgi:hypothetical protein